MAAIERGAARVAALLLLSACAPNGPRCTRIEATRVDAATARWTATTQGSGAIAWFGLDRSRRWWLLARADVGPGEDRRDFGPATLPSGARPPLRHLLVLGSASGEPDPAELEEVWEGLDGRDRIEALVRACRTLERRGLRARWWPVDDED